jgi:hypothetical protein
LGRTVANLLMIHDSRGSFLVLMQAASARNERYKNRFVRPINLWRSRLEALNRCFHLNQSEIFRYKFNFVANIYQNRGKRFCCRNLRGGPGDWLGQLTCPAPTREITRANAAIRSYEKLLDLSRKACARSDRMISLIETRTLRLSDDWTVT